MSNQKFRVTAITKQEGATLTLSFEPLNGKKLNYKAGQFLPLILRVNGRELRRSYSLCSSPALDESPTIAVKLIDNGEISRFIHHQLNVGDLVEIAAPNGQFIYEPETDRERTVFLFAAGVGITPLFSILKTALTIENNSKIVLIYSSRSAAATLFIAELKDWEKRYPDRLKVIHLFSNAKDLFKARLNGFLINELVKENMHFDTSAALFYTCGPVDYMDVCRITLLSAGFKPQQVKRETFILPEDEADDDDTTTAKPKDTHTYSVNLHFGGKVHQVLVPYPRRILEVALENGINLPYSCSGGVCSTCSATCIKGGVRMDYNEVLTDEELATGRVLVCTGHPTANETTISWEL